MLKKTVFKDLNQFIASSEFRSSNIQIILAIKNEDDFTMIGQTLIKFHNLSVLKINLNIAFDGNNIQNFCSALAQLSNLLDLTLCIEARYIKQENLQALISSLNNCLKLSKLDLYFRTYGISKTDYYNSSSLISLGSALAQLNKLSDLTISLNWNGYIEENIKELGCNLDNFLNLKTLNLILEYQSCDDNEYCKFISNLRFALSKCQILENLTLKLYEVSGKLSNLGYAISQCRNIKTLTLDLCYSNNYDDVPLICSILSESNQISSFNLHLNGSQDSYAEIDTQNLYSALSRWNSLNQLSLDFSRNRFEAQDLLNLNLAVVKCSSFSLNLSESETDNKTIQCLATSLAQCSQLQNLILDFKQCKQDLSDLGSALKNVNNLSILKLNLQSSLFSDKSSKELGLALQKIANLSNLTLDISYTLVGNSGIQFLGLKNCLQLSALQLSLEGTYITEIGALSLQNDLILCQKLLILELNLSNTDVEWHLILIAGFLKIKRLIEKQIIN